MLMRPSRAGQREGVAAREGAVADAGEAVGEAGQREGGAALKGVAADAGEAVRQVSTRESQPLKAQ